jgi:general secretion pathway protein L
LALAERLGLKVQRLGLASGDGGQLEFDFTRAVKGGGGLAASSRRRAWLWGACAALAVINVLVAVLEDMNDVRELDRLVEAQRPAVTLAARLRRTVQAEQDRRLALLTRRSVQEPLRILDAVTRSLPQTVWVQRLEWNGRAVRLVGFRSPEADAAAGLQGPALRNVRSLASDMTTPVAGGKVPFDLMADSAAQVRK